MDDLVMYMKGLLAVQARLLQDTNPDLKVDVLLAKVGVPRKDIADMLGKSKAAVDKAILRSSQGNEVS